MTIHSHRIESSRQKALRRLIVRLLCKKLCNKLSFTRLQNEFRAQQNSISAVEKENNNNKKQFEILETQASSNILPPQINLNSIDPTLLPDSEEYPQFDKSNERRNAYSAESEEVKPKGFLPPPTGFEPPRILPNHNDQFRKQEETRLRNLGLPLQSPTQATKFSKTSSAARQTIPSTKNPHEPSIPTKILKLLIISSHQRKQHIKIMIFHAILRVKMALQQHHRQQFDVLPQIPIKINYQPVLTPLNDHS